MIADLASRRDDPGRRKPGDLRQEDRMLGGGVAYIAAVPAVFAVLALRLGAWRTLVALIAVAHLVVLASVALFPLPVDAGPDRRRAGVGGAHRRRVAQPRPVRDDRPGPRGRRRDRGAGHRPWPTCSSSRRRASTCRSSSRGCAAGARSCRPRSSSAARSRPPRPRSRSCSASGTATSTWTTGSSTPSASCSGSPPGGPGIRWPAGARAAADCAARGRVDLPTGPAGSGRCARPRSARNCETARDPLRPLGREP